jgi:hypothetical protein
MKEQKEVIKEEKITLQQKRMLLKIVLDSDSYEAIKNNPKKIKESFIVNLSNILIQTQGEGW